MFLIRALKPYGTEVDLEGKLRCLENTWDFHGHAKLHNWSLWDQGGSLYIFIFKDFTKADDMSLGNDYVFYHFHFAVCIVHIHMLSSIPKIIFFQRKLYVVDEFKRIQKLEL